MAYLVYFIDRNRFEEHLTEADTTIGRDKDCTIRLRGDPEVSRIHCTIQQREDKCYILLDENSKNGTFINGRKVFDNDETVLQDGDVIRLKLCVKDQMVGKDVAICKEKVVF